MSSRFQFKSLSSPEKKKSVAEEFAKNWSYDSFYGGVLTKLSESVKKSELSFDLKLTTNDLNLIKKLQADLKTDGFKSELQSVEAFKKVLLIYGWTSLEAGAVQTHALESIIKVRKSKWFYHTDIWDEAIKVNMNRQKWIIGENVAQNKLDGENTIAYLTRKPKDGPILFSGQSGSGKTEAIRFALLSFLKMNPFTKLYIADLKGTSDYDIFNHFSVDGKVAKSHADVEKMIQDVYEQVEGRSDKQDYFEEKNDPIVFILEDIDQLIGRNTKFDSSRATSLSSANALHHLSNGTGRSNITIIYSTQSPSSMPNGLMKFVRNKLAFRAGSAGDSVVMIRVEDAHTLGRLKSDDIDDNNQTGYFYIGEGGLVRSLQVEDYFIYHELVETFRLIKRPVLNEPFFGGKPKEPSARKSHVKGKYQNLEDEMFQEFFKQYKAWSA